MQEWLLGALGSVPRTVVLVTHDVDEALLLTHKVIVLSARPGRIMVTLDTNFPTNVPAPRDRHVAGVRQPQGEGAGGTGVLNAETPRRPGAALGPRPHAGFEPGQALRAGSGARGARDRDLGDLDPAPRRPETTSGPPSVIVQSMSEESDVLRSATWVTLKEVLLGFAIAIAPAFWSGSSSTSRARSGAPSIRS